MGLEVSFEGVHSTAGSNVGWCGFQVCGAVTEKTDARTVFGAFSSGASDDRRGRTGTAVWIRSFKYAGVEEDRVERRQTVR